MKYFISITIVLFLLNVGVIHAADTKDELNPVLINKILDKTENELKRKIVRIKKLEEYFQEIKTYRAWAVSCVTEKEKEIIGVSEKAKLLGDKVKGETLNVAKKRTDLFKQETNYKKLLATCNVILFRTEDLSNKISLVKQNKIAKQLLSQGPNFLF